VYLLFKEAINNAVKYSDASLLQLSVYHSDQSVEFAISDNGKGFDITTIKKGNGLMNMQKRADDICAQLCVGSVLQKGTVISLRCSIEAS
jgi:signal transduction histidine kinase